MQMVCWLYTCWYHSLIHRVTMSCCLPSQKSNLGCDDICSHQNVDADGLPPREKDHRLDDQEF